VNHVVLVHVRYRQTDLSYPLTSLCFRHWPILLPIVREVVSQTRLHDETGSISLHEVVIELDDMGMLQVA
jgi:hypothetical protein